MQLWNWLDWISYMLETIEFNLTINVFSEDQIFKDYLNVIHINNQAILFDVFCCIKVPYTHIKRHKNTWGLKHKKSRTYSHCGPHNELLYNHTPFKTLAMAIILANKTMSSCRLLHSKWLGKTDRAWTDSATRPALPLSAYPRVHMNLHC